MCSAVHTVVVSAFAASSASSSSEISELSLDPDVPRGTVSQHRYGEVQLQFSPIPLVGVDPNGFSSLTLASSSEENDIKISEEV